VSFAPLPFTSEASYAICNLLRSGKGENASSSMNFPGSFRPIHLFAPSAEWTYA